MPKPPFSKEISGTIWPITEYKGFHTFPRCIFPKVNLISLQEFELAQNDSAVKRFNNYTSRKPQS